MWRFTTGSGGATNQPPSAGSQSVSASEDSPLAITLSGSDPEGAAVSYTLVSMPTHGTLTGAAPNLSYQPAANYSGPDALTFSVSDGVLTSAVATVSIAVQPVNDAPVAVPDAYTVQGGTTLTISAPGVLANDTDVDSSSLTAQVASLPSNGSLTLNANGSFTYTPAAAFSGSDAFSYRASDGGAASAAVSVAITVTPPPADTTPPTVALTAPAAGTVSGNVTLSANATDSGGVAGVQFLLGGVPIGAEDTSAPFGIVWNSTGVANGGPYLLSARARDAAGNQATSAAVAVTVSNGAVPGLVAAYNFNEGSGTTLTDRSGRGHTGAISGAAWSTQGKFGGALSFDGVNDWVTINDTAALDLTTGMTLEAWVLPSTLSGWRTVLLKERSGGLVYSLYTSGDGTRPSGYVATPGEVGVVGPSSVSTTTWTHLAVTYDGATLRLFVNGAQVATRTLTAPIAASTGALRIGGNSVWTEFFRGRIDEVRIYNRALTAAEIQADMSAPITP
jgi:VCBS repeat-containing protein